MLLSFVDRLVMTLAKPSGAKVRSDCVAFVGDRRENLRDIKRESDNTVPPDVIYISWERNWGDTEVDVKMDGGETVLFVQMNVKKIFGQIIYRLIW